MAKIIGAIAITGPMAPTDDQDTYPVAFNDHIKGGWKNVQDSVERLAIPADRREEGMKAYEITTNKLYHLIGGIDDTNWLEVSFGQAGIDDAPNDGKMYYRKNNAWVEYAQATDGADIYMSTDPVTATIGGILAGENLSGKTAVEIIDLLIHPYQAPTFSSFSLGLTQLEIGAPIPTPVTFSWGATQPANINTNSITISENGGTVFGAGLANDGSEIIDIGASVLNTTGSKTFKIEATNTKGVIFSRTTSVNWVARIYYGESILESLDESGIKSLRTSKLGSTKAGTYIFNDGGYKYIAYPDSFGDFNTFKDVASNMDVVLETPFTLVDVVVNGVTVSYRVYKSLNILNGSLTVAIS